MEAKSYTFTKKINGRGNLEMRVNFGFQKVAVFTYVNGYFYLNLYNNSKANPGRCSISYAELEELIRMKEAFEPLKQQMVEEHNHLHQQPQQQPKQHQVCQSMNHLKITEEINPQPQMQPLVPLPPAATPIPTPQPIPVIHPNKRRSTNWSGEPPHKRPKMEEEENWDPLTFFTKF